MVIDGTSDDGNDDCDTLASVLSVVVDDEGDAGGDTVLLKLLTFMVCGMPLTMPTRSFLRGSGFWLTLEFLFDCNTGDDLSLCFVDWSFAFALVLDFLGESNVDLEAPFSWLAIVDCVLSWSDRCRMNWTSFEYSPHFVRIYFCDRIGKVNWWRLIQMTNELCLTFNGFSFGAISRSLFRHRSIKVNRPILPVACANAKTTSWNRVKWKTSSLFNSLDVIAAH